jgi:hypothetical protein
VKLLVKMIVKKLNKTVFMVFIYPMEMKFKLVVVRDSTHVNQDKIRRANSILEYMSQKDSNMIILVPGD